MLTFERTEGQEIRFWTSNGEIRLVLDIVQGRRTTISIEAPKAVTVLRGEVEPEPAKILARLATAPAYATAR